MGDWENVGQVQKYTHLASEYLLGHMALFG